MKGILVLHNDILMVEYIKDPSKGTTERLPATKAEDDIRDVGDEVEFVIWTGGRRSADEPEVAPEAWIQKDRPRTYTEEEVIGFANAIEGKSQEYKQFVRDFVNKTKRPPTTKDKLVWWNKTKKS